MWNSRELRSPFFLRFSGLCTFTALLILAGGISSALLLQHNEDAAEFLLIASPLVTPLLLLPLNWALYMLYHASAPRLSRVLVGIGGCSGLAFVLIPIMYLFAPAAPTPTLPIQPWLLLWYGLLLTSGCWPILGGIIELTRTTPVLGGAMGWAIPAGVTWLMVMGCALLRSWMPTIADRLASDALLLLTLPVLAATFSLWLVHVGFRLVRSPATLLASV